MNRLDFYFADCVASAGSDRARVLVTLSVFEPLNPHYSENQNPDCLDHLAKD